MNAPLGAYQRWECHSSPDGRVVGLTSTNDPDDCGGDCGFDEWPVTYRDREEFLRRVSGGSGAGMWCQREVFLDGVEIVAP